MRYTVLSAGSWGVCLAMLLNSKGFSGSIWAHRAQTATTLEQTRSHPKLPGRLIPAEINISNDLGSCLTDCDLVVCTTPALGFREVCKQVIEQGWAGKWFVVGSKGIDTDSLELMHQMAITELGSAFETRVALLSGPSHAEEVAGQLPTAVTISAADIKKAKQLKAVFETDFFQVEAHTDMVGIGLTAALKNVVALACGISDGLGFGDNAKAAILTYGLREIGALAKAMTGNLAATYGLGGMGDLVVTCMSRHSRNWRCGYLIGQGLLPNQALQEVGMVVEGAYSMIAAKQLAQKHDISMPVIAMVNEVMQTNIAPQPAILKLLNEMANAF